MPITFTCPCGQTLSASDEHAGLPVACPSCGQTPIVPHQLWDSPHAAAGPEPKSAKPWQKGADPATDDARPRPAPAAEEGWFNGGVAGGALTMFIAVVWFFGALMLDWIAFYPPILFVIGLITFFKGLMTSPDSHE